MLLLSTACGRSSPTTPTPAGTSPVAGEWRGIVTGVGATRTVRMTLDAYLSTGTGALLAGRYEASSTAGSDSGTVGGAVLDRQVSLVFTPAPVPVCSTPILFTPGQMSLQLAFDGVRLTGQGAINLCPASEPIEAVFTRP